MCRLFCGVWIEGLQRGPGENIVEDLSAVLRLQQFRIEVARNGVVKCSNNRLEPVGQVLSELDLHLGRLPCTLYLCSRCNFEH